MVGEGGVVNIVIYTLYILEEQVFVYMGFVILDGLFVYNIKGYLELVIVRDRKLFEEWVQKGCV